jgi:hypothetical protein
VEIADFTLCFGSWPACLRMEAIAFDALRGDRARTPASGQLTSEKYASPKRRLNQS